jgi:hypothetical protein
VNLAVRPERNTRKLCKRFGQGTVLITWLVEQATMVERVCGRAKGRRNRGALLIEAVGDGSVIRIRLLCSASGEGGRCAHQDHSSHAVKLGLAIDRVKPGHATTVVLVARKFSGVTD